jgi:hypothetical protein
MCKTTIGNEGLQAISNDNGISVVNFATSKNLIVKSTMFSHRKVHKYFWASPDEKTHNQIDNFLIDRQSHSSVLHVRSFRAADCDTDHYLMVAKCRVRLAVNDKKIAQISHGEVQFQEAKEEIKQCKW